jgi:hypothetical protein
MFIAKMPSIDDHLIRKVSGEYDPELVTRLKFENLGKVVSF